MVCWIEGGAGFILFSVLPGGAVQLPGRSRPAREERIVRTRFGIGISSDHTLEEVGQQFSVTRERIRQIEAKALRKLKHPSRSKSSSEASSIVDVPARAAYDTNALILGRTQ